MQSLEFGCYPFGYFTVDYWGEILKDVTGWGVGNCLGAISSAVPTYPIQLPTVNHPELVTPRTVAIYDDDMKSDVKPIQTMEGFGPAATDLSYQINVPLPAKFLGLISSDGSLSLRVEVRLSAQQGSFATDPSPTVEFDISEWVSSAVIASASLTRSANTWVYRTTMAGLVTAIKSAKARCVWHWTTMKTYNTRFSCDWRLEGTYYRAFFDASLVPPEDEDQSSEACYDLSTVWLAVE